MEASQNLLDTCQDVLLMPIATSDYAKTQSRNLGVGHGVRKAKHKGKCATTKRWGVGIAKAKQARMVSKVCSTGATKLFALESSLP